MVNRIKSILLIAILCFSIASFAGCGSVEKPDKGTRIVVLDNVSLEILYNLGLDVVGVPSSGYEATHEKYANKEIYADVGIPMAPNYMQIALLNPSEVIMSDATEKAFGNIKSSFEALDIIVHFYDYNSIDTLKSSINRMGEYFEKSDEATALIERLNADEAEVLSAATAYEDKPRVMTLFGAPLGSASQSISIATSGLYGGSLVTYSGAINVMDALYPSGKPAMIKPDNWAPILDLDPDYIFCTAHGDAEAVWAMYDSCWNTSPWNLLSAVKKGRVYYLPEDIVGVIATLNYTEAIAYVWDIFEGKMNPYGGGYVAA